MTVIFALLAALGAAGLVFSLLGQGKGGQERSFKDALKEADGPGQDLARRLELLEEKAPGQQTAISTIFVMARQMELLEEKIKRLEESRLSSGGSEEGKNGQAASSFISAAAYGGRHGAQPRLSAGPAPRESEIQPVRRRSALSKRMTAVWEAAEKNSDPLEIAKALNMGVSEVELALKVKSMRQELVSNERS